MRKQTLTTSMSLNMKQASNRLRNGSAAMAMGQKVMVYFTIDGERLITAWEADRGKAWARLPYELSPGTYKMELHAADRAGNETVVKSTFSVLR